MSEHSIVREKVGAPAVLEFEPTLEFGWSRHERWPRREFWAKLVACGTIGVLVGVVLATEVNLRGMSLIGVTATITAIWSLALWRSAHVARVRRLEPFWAASLATGSGFVAVSLLNVWILELTISPIISPGQLLFMAGSVFLLTGSFHTMAARGLTPRRRVAVVGMDDDSLDLIRELRDGANGKFECIGVVGEAFKDVGLGEVQFLGGTEDLAGILWRDRPDVIVCSSDLYGWTVDRLLDAGVTTVRVLDCLDFNEHAFRRVESRRVSSYWFASVLDIHRQSYSARTKRVFDVTIALLALCLAWPLLLVIPLLIRLSSPGPVLFRQFRMGEGGELFEMVKFRTMIDNAEVGEAVWASEGDPRVTRIGRVLRRTRMDELPQLLNVLRGEMSIVGPRPERAEFLAVLRGYVPFWSRRDLLKPGITGWAQVHHAYTADVSGAASKLSYDLYYLKHRSLTLDALILLKTFKVVLSGSGAR